MKIKITEIKLNTDNRIEVPDLLHFIWIGDTKNMFTEYIKVWQTMNPGKKIYLWHDEGVSMCHFFHQAIKDYVDKKNHKNKINMERKIKYSAFYYIFSMIKKGSSFNLSAMLFLLENKIITSSKNHINHNAQVNISGIQLRNINDLFISNHSLFIKYYYYEIILRGNLASASDIIRLLIIYKYGGTYLDLDTLPNFNVFYKKTIKTIEKTEFINDNFLMMFMTRKILNKFSLDSASDIEFINHYNEITLSDLENHKLILKAINDDISNFSLKNNDILGRIYVHKDLLRIGTIKRFKGIYFNSFISSHPKSKIIRLILRSMKIRYSFLEKNNCIFEFNKNKINDKYLSRILPWRMENLSKTFSITPIVTGTGLIMEVMLGIAYEILDITELTTPMDIAIHMHDEELGIACFQQNVDTPEGTKSSWRDNSFI